MAAERLQPAPPPAQMSFELTLQTPQQSLPAGGELFFRGDSLLFARIVALMGLEVARVRLVRDSLEIWDRFNGRIVMLGARPRQLPFGLALPEPVRFSPALVWTWLSGRDLARFWSDSARLELAESEQPSWRGPDVRISLDPTNGLPARLERYAGTTLLEERRYEEWSSWNGAWLPRRILVRRPREGWELVYRLRALSESGAPPEWNPPPQLPRLRW
ncbi:MAG: hypothetical protein N2561_07165 [Bacteroidetes bacterium]|nr:hypothetical protein [Rhodothermia bacterium]MCS7155015.1 hypothetical protein [Bacteroidota bacterium]MCX7907299.1 hypothetical protein [Bacteroidota bacterium]MDW8137974.1 hypothetical protein [Bacteroidota bacterium]MDW8286174.1 hypothetical protein [Bacteroidota bacterium]